MKKITVLIFITILATACEVVDEAEEITKTLQTVYDACGDENIDSLGDIENVINANGNDLSLACRNSFQEVKLPELSSKLKLSISLDTPFNEVIATSKDKLFSLTELSAQNKKVMLSGIYTNNFDLSTLIKSDVLVSGIDENGISTSISDFSISNPWNESAVAVSYVQDYSGSMFASQLTKIGSYMQDFDSLINQTSKRSLIRFADDINDVSQGFTSDTVSIQDDLAYDTSEVQGGTSLYDAWGSAIGQLNTENSDLKLVVLATDGGENNSESYNKAQLKELVSTSNAFHVVFGSFFARKSNLVDILGERGVLLYTFQIDSLKDNIDELVLMLQRSVNLEIHEDISPYESIQVTINDVQTNLLIN